MAQKVTKVGIIGVGNISPIYLSNMTKVFKNVEVKSVADKIHERAINRSNEFGPAAVSVADLLADPEIEIVVNLTNPDQHYIVNKQIVTAKKHAHSEKPYNGQLSEAQEIMELARKNGVRSGSAPDTFMGAGIQTCIKLINDGFIGNPIAATAFMTGRGHESWHPDPEFYYKPAAGPMFDMGPYYITALVAMLGQVERVCGSATKKFATRKITSEPKFGSIIDVEVPTHTTGAIDFSNGCTATIIMSFDMYSSGRLPCIEVYGTEGTIIVPDPNGFGGPVMMKRHNTDFKEVPVTHCYSDNSRGLGVCDLASAIQTGRKHRCCDELTYHALEVMHAFDISSQENKHYFMKSKCEKPAPMPMVLEKGEID